MYKKYFIHVIILVLPSCQFLSCPEVEEVLIHEAEVILEKTDQFVQEKAG